LSPEVGANRDTAGEGHDFDGAVGEELVEDLRPVAGDHCQRVLGIAGFQYRSGEPEPG
jgi:hypothetical protein